MRQAVTQPACAPSAVASLLFSSVTSPSIVVHVSLPVSIEYGVPLTVIVNAIRCVPPL